MFSHLRLPGESNREGPTKPAPDLVDEQLRGTVAPVVLALGIHNQALRTAADSRDRNPRLGTRIGPIDERPGTHRDAAGPQPLDQRRGELGVGHRTVTGFHVELTDPVGHRIPGESLGSDLGRNLTDPQCSGVKRGSGGLG
jgi:hypothetical protein